MDAAPLALAVRFATFIKYRRIPRGELFYFPGTIQLINARRTDENKGIPASPLFNQQSSSVSLLIDKASILLGGGVRVVVVSIV